MLINLSNHPSDKWSEAQAQAAKPYGETVNLPFPSVDPEGDEAYIANLADKYCKIILDMANGKPCTVHIMGEMTLTFALVKKLQTAGITCLASTTQRVFKESSDGRKESLFQFVTFRKYL